MSNIYKHKLTGDTYLVIVSEASTGTATCTVMMELTSRDCFIFTVAELAEKFTHDGDIMQCIAEAVMAEREACAKIAEDLGAGFVEDGMSSAGRGAQEGAQRIAAAIRNRT